MAIIEKPPTQRMLNTVETKKRLFETALSLFSQYGYNKVTVEDITRVAGFSKGTFYSYFQTKEHVLLEQFSMIDAQYEEAFRDVTEEMSAPDQVLLLIQTMCRYCADVVGVAPLQVVYSNQITSPDTIQILNNSDRVVYRILRGIAPLGRSSGAFPADITDDYFAEIIMRFARGVIFDWCMYNGSFDLEAEGLQYFEAILYLFHLAAKDDAPKRPTWCYLNREQKTAPEPDTAVFGKGCLRQTD